MISVPPWILGAMNIYHSNFGKVVRRVHPEGLDRDPETLIVNHPYVRASTTVIRHLRLFVTNGDL